MIDKDRFIDVYNCLTEFTDNPDENFLKSLSYKIKNGEILVSVLSLLKDKNIEYTINKGFINNLEEYNTFSKCEILIQGNINNAMEVIKREFSNVVVDVFGCNTLVIDIV